MALSGDAPSSRTRWLDAVDVLAVIVVVILAARQLRPLVEAGAFLARTGDPLSVVPWEAWPRAGAWLAISVAVLSGWRTVAALGAWAGVLFEIVVALPHDAVPLDLRLWPPALATVAAVLVSGSAAAAHGTAWRHDRLGHGGHRLLAAAAAVTALSAAAIPLLGDYYEPLPGTTGDPGWHVSFVVSSNLARAVAGVTFAAIAALALAAGTVADRAVRSRVHTLMAAGAAGFVAIQLGFPRPFGALDYPVLAHPAQAAVFLLVPGLVLGAGRWWIRSAERPHLREAAGGA
ncbi:hypothetical protein ACFO1B_40825 [Dactylosporangium siamense]|uniref:Uncharacterized protein n=1 Tax=Dactylosporangium siamense TaxID=685454 RepID=A0A919PD65_9ACTN|nr:hypothetical protein [Dactylosporangium siamense]GIG42601.1 hypothetical protein Dsi01nite_006420 [Dactylosporangium siamense]